MGWLKKLKEWWPVAQIIGWVVGATNAAINFIVHYSLIVGFLVGGGAVVGFLYNAKFAGAALAGLLAFASVQVITWQTAIRSGQYRVPALNRRALSVKVWFHPRSAVGQFADERLLKKYVAAREAHEQAQQAKPKGPRTGTELLKDALSVYGYDSPHITTWVACQEDVLQRLRRGDLIARAMSPSNPHEELLVKSHEWRILMLDFQAATAIGSGLEYVGVV